MSVRPVKFNADGSVDIWHDEGNHGATIAAVDLHFGVPGGPTGIHSTITLGCPRNDGSSSYPITGGADAAAAQELYVRLAARLGCPCGQVPAGRPIAVVQAHVKLQSERGAEGVGRWQAGVLH